ncbi:MAG: helix-turn-helix domain-containing protein [Methanosarcinaceae archaeon]|nr:helix-turn-helix domain-containing protein [Methanosarcinaceae archaeon]
MKKVDAGTPLEVPTANKTRVKGQKYHRCSSNIKVVAVTDYAPDELFLPLEEAAHRCGRHPSKLRELINKGKLPVVENSIGLRRIPECELYRLRIRRY